MTIVLKTDYPVALQSPDHIKPWGTKRDNSKSPRFLRKVSRLFSEEKGELSLLDIGCSGGGWVKQAHDKGWMAVGLEGSDYSKRTRRAEWAIIPEYLFTCDVTKPFQLSLEGAADNLKFSLITSWEVLEHISESDLAQLFLNVKNHLKNGGLFIVSVSPNEEYIDGVRLHQTVKPAQWWIKTARENGFYNLPDYLKYFNGHYVRGPKYGAPQTFHLVLTNDPALAPKPRQISWKNKLLDFWLESKPHRLLRLFIIGDRE